MQPSQFLDHLAAKGLLEDEVLSELREQVDNSDGITVEAITKLLVDNGHLTKFQATKLVGEIGGGKDSGSKGQKAARPSDDPDLGLAPLSHENLAAAADDDDDEVVDLVDASQPEPAKKTETRSAKSERAARGKRSQKADRKTKQTSQGKKTTDKGSSGKSASSGRRQSWQGEPASDDPLAGNLAADPLGIGGADPLTSGLAADPSMGGDPMTGAAPIGRPMQTLNPRKKPKGSVWESKKMIGGSLLFGLLAVAGIWLLISLLTGDAKVVFKEAEKLYLDGSYMPSRAIYEKYIKKYSKGEDISLARVRYRMARLQDARRNPNTALKVAQEVLPKIVDEKAFAEARVDLETLLPDIVEGFADLAVQADDPTEQKRLLDLSDEAMELVNTGAYLPTSVINKSTVQTKLKSIEEKRKTARREIDKEATLRQAIADMTSLTGQGKTLEALARRKELLLVYPGLDIHKDLVKTTLATTVAERALVKPGNQEIAAETTEQPDSKVAQTVPSTLTGKPITNARGHVGYALTAGRLFAIDVATGKLLWARFLGTESVHHPLRVSDKIGADVVVSDLRTNEVMRLDAQTGKVKWRANIGESFAQPQSLPNRVVVSAEQRLVVLDVETGTAIKHASFPLPLRVGVSYDQLAQKYYQLGDHSNLYVISEKTLACDEVYYFGHKAGSIDVPPVSAVGFVLVCQNVGTKSTMLHVLQTKDGLALKPAMDPIQLTGRVRIPPLLFGRKALVLTDLGAIYVYDVDPNNTAEPLSEVAAVPASYTEPTLAYPLVENSRLWLVERRFIKYLVLPSKGKLVRQFVEARGQYLAPSQLYGDVLLQVRRPSDGRGIRVSAKLTDSDGAESDWELDLAVPTALTIDPTSNQVRAITGRSGLFAVGSGTQVLTDKPQVADRGEASFTQPVRLGNGVTVLSELNKQNQLLVYDPATDAKKLTRVSLQGIQGQASSRPVQYQGGLLIPFRNGRIGLFDWKTGGERAMPFFPPLSGGQSVKWSRPVVVGDSFIICDDQKQIRRINVQAEPRPHLSVQQQLTLENPLHTELAKSGEVVLAVVRGQSVDTVQSIKPADLTLGDKVELKGRVVWGPDAVGELVFVATSANLHCFEGAKQKWSTPLPYGRLAGAPVKEGDDYLLASGAGTVWRVSGADGKETTKIELGRPVAGGVLVHEGRMLLPSYDGTVLAVPVINPS